MKKKLFLLLLCLTLTACGSKPAPSAPLDLDAIAETLTASGYFPETLEAQDPGLIPGQLSLYEDRIEAAPEDLVQGRYSMGLGVVADQFLLLEAADEAAADRLERALEDYADDQRSAYEFYSPDQAARMDDPIVERRGRYLLFAIGGDMRGLSDLCGRLMDGEAVELPEGGAAAEGGQSAPTEDRSNGLTPLTGEEVTAAREAAMSHYRDTVFAVSALEELEPAEGEIAFRVTCTRGGAAVPDRTICLERQNGVWTVVNEGY